MNLDLAGTAKALSDPVTKLIEVCAAGCGKLYEPMGIRRRARAEGDALIITEEARGRSELARRAAQRQLDVEEPPDFWKERGLDFMAIQALEAGGLVGYQPEGMTMSMKDELLVLGTSRSLLIKSATASEFQLGNSISLGRV